MNRLDHVLTNNLKNNYDQSNEAINIERTFDTTNFNLSSGTSYLLPVVTVYLRGGIKRKTKTVDGLTCLWNIGTTNIMLNRQHNNHYESKIKPSKREYSTATGACCKTHTVKVPFACRISL